MKTVSHISGARNSKFVGTTLRNPTPPRFPLIGPGLTPEQRTIRLNVQRWDEEDRRAAEGAARV